jgi:hypothetical protein
MPFSFGLSSGHCDVLVFETTGEKGINLVLLFQCLQKEYQESQPLIDQLLKGGAQGSLVKLLSADQYQAFINDKHHRQVDGELYQSSDRFTYALFEVA